MISAFWSDYANHLLTPPNQRKTFLSANFVQNIFNPVSALMTIAILDLPFTKVTHTYQTNDARGLEITAESPIILFKKEVKEAPLDLSNDILVTHRYVDASVNQASQSAAMPEEFLVNKAYQCEVIMTNVSPQQRNFSVLFQVP